MISNHFKLNMQKLVEVYPTVFFESNLSCSYFPSSSDKGIRWTETPIKSRLQVTEDWSRKSHSRNYQNRHFFPTVLATIFYHDFQSACFNQEQYYEQKSIMKNAQNWRENDTKMISNIKTNDFANSRGRQINFQSFHFDSWLAWTWLASFFKLKGQSQDENFILQTKHSNWYWWGKLI